ncbi:sigma-54-dependent Fis family transcriptional regulator [Stagnihabitans tardus]|uniref:AAA family ATPase n=1 Tax=Stagnihabitans tardus TaxID=2699202 RepID=A0AAE4YDZ0_9RHOB|nr:sigma 54-interacting transcriptional regulator [Stagnihabitans tardus]NBZ89573.1 AAA family ATPase [Stagnihabitans tardus]
MWETEALEAKGFNDPLSSEIESILRARGVAEARLPDLVEQSWKRCLTDYNLLPDAVPRAAVLSHSEIQALMQEREEFLRIAEPEVERLFRQLVDSEYLVSLASSQGAMMLFRCDYQYLGDLAGSGVIPGSVWTEDAQGTNGVGTCLRVGKPVIIAGAEHYGAATQRLTCLTAPVLGRGGAIESVINVTTARQADARVNKMVQQIVERSARRIENGYFGRLNRRNLMLRILDNGETGDIAEEGRLALDENGRVLDGSSFATRLLGRPVGQLVGQQAEEIFELDQSFADLRPDAPIRLNFQGRSLQAVLTHPETRTRSPRALVSPRATAPTLRTVDLAEEPLRINPILSQAMDRARRLLSAGLPLVVTGESGSGKTAFAKAVARVAFGDEAETVFIDCASLEAQVDLGALLQARLTGQRSCLLIDRIDEMDETRQTALLALLENDRQAGANGIGVIVISTQDLDTLVRDGRMRTDLMHRLKGGQVALAPLRAAPDLEATIRDLFHVEREKLGRPEVEMDEDSRLVLSHYHWPGNLRELRNTLRHAVALADGKLIGMEHLPDDIVDEIARKDLTARSQSEASKIEAALRYNGGNVSLTARYLGVSRATLYRKIQIQKARDET